MGTYVILVMLATFFTKIIGFARELLLSYFFGAGNISDAYLVSLAIPGTIFQLVGTGLATSFIPIYLKLKKQNKLGESQIFTNTVATCILILSIIVCVLVWIFSKEIVLLFASGFSDEALSYGILFTRINVLSLLLATFIYVFISYLQANEKILEAQLSAIPYGLTMLLSIVLGATINVIFLPIISITASLIQLIFLIICVRKNKYKYRPKLAIKNESFKKFLTILAPVIIGISINDINALIDKTMASNVAIGAISALSYSISLLMFIQGIFAQPIASIYYPKITKLINSNEKEKLSKHITESLGCVLFFLVPIAAFCLISSKNIVEILYGRGAFDSNATALTSLAFLGYSVGVIWIGCRELFSRIFYASRNTKVPTINAAIGGVLNIALNIVLSKIWGIFGLALATSISAIITTALLYNSLRKRNIYKIDKVFINQLFKIILCSLLMVSTITIFRFIDPIKSNIWAFIAESSMGIIIYFLTTLLFKIRFAEILTKNIKHALSRKNNCTFVAN